MAARAVSGRRDAIENRSCPVAGCARPALEYGPLKRFVSFARALAFAFACCAAPQAGAEAAAERNDYANPRFAAPLGAGLERFYARDFGAAQHSFERALGVVADNTLAIAFVNACAAQQPGGLDALLGAEEDALAAAPRKYIAHVRLGFSYMFASLAGRDRLQDAREEFGAALALDPAAPAARVGLGIMRFNERSANRSKTELLQALRADPSDVLAREYLGQLYQTDLRDPRRGLAYMIGVPNLVPQYADILFHVGSVLHDLAQPDLALVYLKRGVALDARHVGEAGQHGYTLMARIYIEQHRLAAARDVLDAALADDVDAIYAKTLLGKIKSGEYDAAPTSPSPGKY